MSFKEKLSDEWRTPDELFDELNQEFNFSIDLCATAENTKCYFYFKDYLVFSSADSIKEDNVHMFLKDANCAFMNPPYSNPKPFIEKAWEDSKHCKIVCLVKCDPSTRWWATFWDYSIKCTFCSGLGEWERDQCWPTEKCVLCFGTGLYNGPKPGCEVRFFPKRIKFDPPKELIDSGEVKLIKGKWHIKNGHIKTFGTDPKEYFFNWKPLSGPTFPCALVIMDRRNIND